MNIGEKFKVLLADVTPEQTTTGIDGKEYKYINVKFTPDLEDEWSFEQPITKAIFPDNEIMYKIIKRLADAAEEEDLNKFEELLEQFNKKKVFFRKVTDKISPFYVTDEKGKPAVYGEHQGQRAGLQIISDNCTMFVFNHEDPEQEVESYVRRLQSKGLLVQPADAKALATKAYDEKIRAMLNKRAQSDSTSSETREPVKETAKNEEETPQ